MDVIFTERAYTNSPHLFIETVWPCYTVQWQKTDWDVRIESVFHSSVKPYYPDNSIQVVGKGAIV